VGEAPDPRSQRVAQAHGITLTSRAQQFNARDFERFDLILALDAEIYDNLHHLAPTEAARAKIRLLREADPLAQHDYDVPDPYYGGLDGFEDAYAMIERACRGWLAQLVLI
jgi:protein-tyrosine phosphatase